MSNYDIVNSILKKYKSLNINIGNIKYLADLSLKGENSKNDFEETFLNNLDYYSRVTSGKKIRRDVNFLLGCSEKAARIIINKQLSSDEKELFIKRNGGDTVKLLDDSAQLSDDEENTFDKLIVILKYALIHDDFKRLPSIYDLFDEDDVKSVIDYYVIELLNYEEKKVLNYYNNMRLSINEKHLNERQKRVLDGIIKKGNVILKRKEDKNIRTFYKKYLSIYDLLCPYTKEEVDTLVIPRLTKVEYELIVKRSGGTDFSIAPNTNEVLTKYEQSRFIETLNTMFRLLEDKEFRNNYPRKLKMREVKDLLDTKEFMQIKKIMQYTNWARVVALKLGYNKNNRKYKNKEIGTILGIDDEIIDEVVEKCLTEFKTRLDEMKNKKIK